ncbi:MAG: kelch repeat-containing protein, partial [Candidatus Limnocylindrales bacterium]
MDNALVLIAGGNAPSKDGPAIASAELYNPETGTFTVTGSMKVARSGHAAVQLPNHKILITGGTDAAGPGGTQETGTGTEPAGSALELVLPGAEGAPRPQDLLQIFIPKNIASLVRIQRLEIRYKCGETFVDPVGLID